MTWTKREVDTNLVILGDAEGNVRKVGGLLASIRPDLRYPDNRRYELVQQNATVKSVAGSTSINSQLGPADVGKFVKLEFVGWGSGANGKFKKIDIQVFEGDVSEQMKTWPHYAELHSSTKAPGDSGPLAQPDEEDDALPF